MKRRSAGYSASDPQLCGLGGVDGPHHLDDACAWTTPALKDAEEIRDYIARDSPHYARLVVERIVGAVEALRSAQARGTSRWRAFDARCRLEVKVEAGAMVCAPLGPPGDERPDVYGDALNRLFKAPSGDFVVMPEVDALLW